ncbi:MAG TPA: alpha/beta fold hydrolase [Candidatus Acidoferrum sp.]|jgi:hypothetical protein
MYKLIELGGGVGGGGVLQGFLHEAERDGVRGQVRTGARADGGAVVLTHGAGGNCESKLLVEVAEALAAAGFAVFRFDLPFRAERRTGPPMRGSADHDREGLRLAAALMKKRSARPVFLAGHSYGGRQASMLLAEAPDAADGLLLLSYPLHPPRKPEELRTGHLAQVGKPAFFVHGTRDPFGTIEEMKMAVKLIPARHALQEVEGAGHDLMVKRGVGDLGARVAQEFLGFLGGERG